MEIIVSEKHKNIKIVDSYLVTDKHKQQKIVAGLLALHPWFRERSLNSYVREWRSHNRLYRLHFKVESTKDCDLNVEESLIRRFFYFFLGF